MSTKTRAPSHRVAEPSITEPSVAEPSKVERIKEASRGLRGPLAEEIGNDASHLSEAAKQILKFHGSYEQDDRDVRRDRKKAGLEPAYSFMIRSRVPGGVLSAEQYLVHDDIADRFGGGTLRLTTRQTIQLHGVLKGDLPRTIHALNDALVTTLATCGDVNRNVMTCPVPGHGGLRDEALAVARRISEHLLPRTRAYHEIWIDGELAAGGEPEPDPIYGDRYLPRKFKTAIGFPNDNCTDVYSNDLGFLAIPESNSPPQRGETGRGVPVSAESSDRATSNSSPQRGEAGRGVSDRADSSDRTASNSSPQRGEAGRGVPVRATHHPNGGSAPARLAGFNVLVGGGLGQTHGKEETYPRLADALAFITPDEVLDVATAVVTTQRDFGNRGNRRRARLKYLIDERGLDWFRAEVERRLGRPLRPPAPVTVSDVHDHLGWHEQGDGLWYYGLFVENGRIKDDDDGKLRTALRHIVATYRPGVHLTPQQNLLLTGIREADRPAIEHILASHGVATHATISTVRRWAMACPALPTCPLALAEAERVMPGILDEIEVELGRLGLAETPFTVRMTGCPNGCARPYTADVAFVGRSLDKYVVYIGGNMEGTRLAEPYADLVPRNQLVATVRPLLERFRAERLPGERFGDFWNRVGRDALETTRAAS